MGVEVEGVEELIYLLRQKGKKAVKGAFTQMRQEAKDIRDLAREMAPVDEGDLERAIVTREVGGGRDEFSGQFVRKEIVIEVDGEVNAGTNREGKQSKVGDYAYIMHEHLAPFGSFKLGKRSRAKQAASNVLVGGKYLERAVAEREKGLINRIIDKVEEALD